MLKCNTYTGTSGAWSRLEYVFIFSSESYKYIKQRKVLYACMCDIYTCKLYAFFTTATHVVLKLMIIIILDEFYAAKIF